MLIDNVVNFYIVIVYLCVLSGENQDFVFIYQD